METRTLQNENGTTKVNGVTIPTSVPAEVKIAVALVNHFDEVMSKQMQETCTVLKLSAREREELVLGAIRNALRARLSAEAKNLRAFIGKKYSTLCADGLAFEKIQERIGPYEKDAKKFEALHEDLAK